VNRLTSFKWFPPCPDGHRWYRCAHEELALRPIGFGLMAVGVASAAASVAHFLR